MSRYFVKWKGVESGPYSAGELRDMYNAGKIGLIHYVREENSANWHLFREFLSGENIGEAASPVDDAKKTSLYIESDTPDAYRNGAALDADVLRGLVPYPELFDKTMIMMESLGLVSKSEYGSYDEDEALKLEIYNAINREL